LPSTAIISSGPLSYPSNRPIGAVFTHENGKGGKIAVIGSYTMFTDEYFEKEENEKLFDFVMKFLLTQEVQIEVKKQDEEFGHDYANIPDIGEISDSLKSCLQESEDLP